MKGSIKVNRILSDSVMPKKGECCVYQLIDKQGIVFYVGQTKDMKRRLYKHIYDGKNLDSFKFDVVEESQMNNIEAQKIINLKPRLNKTLPINDFYTTKGLLNSQLTSMLYKFIRDIDTDFEIPSTRKNNSKHINVYKALIIKDAISKALSDCENMIKIGE